MNLPNFLSLVRLLLVPVFARVFFLPIPTAHQWAALIYAAAFATDIADGYIARRFHQVTRLGRILDPLADKLMTLTVILCITADGILPLWAVAAFFCKELLMALGGLFMLRRTRDVIPANWLGKASTGVFFVVLAALVLFPIPYRWAVGLISFALLLAFAALFCYAAAFWCLMKDQSPSNSKK
ncbi:MAG: CDP-diacylglycerol--glycerol-3-phosphate 3-phosphatidyltransferase [Pseudoflavonifractor sp.]|nr:CDP-diacylglycerol--glycerol-3-phosphate 3-phosphatidyltransferase [Pseudoflavonifractor sp.]